MDGIAWYHPLAIAADLKINFSIKSMTSAFCIVWSTDSTAYKHRSRATGNFSNKCQKVQKKLFFLEKKTVDFQNFFIACFVHTVAWKTPVTSYKKVHTRYFVWNSSYKLIYLQFSTSLRNNLPSKFFLRNYPILILQCFLFLPPAKLREGYVFTSVCQSFCPRQWGGPLPSNNAMWRQTPPPIPPCRPHSSEGRPPVPIRSTGRRYAFHWNAYLLHNVVNTSLVTFFKFFDIMTTKIDNIVLFRNNIKI